MPLNYSMASREIDTGGIKCLVYGPAGTGKTVLSATMPKPILISAESGTLSLSKQNLERLFGVGNPHVTYDIPLLIIRNIDDLVDVNRWAYSSAEAQQFESIGLDSISEIAEVVLSNAKKGVKDPRQAYGELIDKMESTVRSFRDLPRKNVLFCAKMEPMKDDLTGVVKYLPSMPGSKLGPKLPYFFDEVFRLGINRDAQGKDFRFLQTQPDMQYEAKDRSGALDKLEYPFLAAVFAKILGKTL